MPEQGVKLTPRHYAYLNPEGCKSPLHLLHYSVYARRSGEPSDCGEVLSEAKRLDDAGVKEI